MAQRVMVTTEAIARVARAYSDALAVIDSPAYKAAEVRNRAWQDGYTAAIREVMVALVGERKWDALRHELDDRNFLALMDEARAVAPGEQWMKFL